MATTPGQGDDAAKIRPLDGLLAAGYFLVHITGYKQPKDEWFDVIRTGQFHYHKIDIGQDSLSVSVTGVTAEVTGRGIFNATINGMRNPWRLQLAMTWAKGEQGWKLCSSMLNGDMALSKPERRRNS